jgi:hypothetical protein
MGAAPDALLNTETYLAKRRNKYQHWLTEARLSPNSSIEMIDLNN